MVSRRGWWEIWAKSKCWIESYDFYCQTKLDDQFFFLNLIPFHWFINIFDKLFAWLMIDVSCI
jgi:hypothetical protein